LVFDAQPKLVEGIAARDAVRFQLHQLQNEQLFVHASFQAASHQVPVNAC